MAISHSYRLTSTSFINRKPRQSTHPLYAHELHSTIEATQCLSSVDFHVLESAAAGSLAGGLRAVSRGLTFPFDSMKTFEQAKLTGGKQRTMGEYFRGVIPTVVTAIPANAIFFIVYEYLMQCIPCAFHQVTGVQLLEERLVMSAIATIPQNFIKIPAELIKQRAQIQDESDFGLIVEQLTAIRGWNGLFLGSGAMLLREIPYNALQMASFSAIHDRISVYDIHLSAPLQSAIIGLFAAAFAALLTQPADVIKTRIMTDLEAKELELEKVISLVGSDNADIEPSRGGGGGSLMASPGGGRRESSSAEKEWWQQINVVRHTVEVVQEEGVKGLFSGLGPRLALVSIGGMVYFWAASLTDVYFNSSS